MLKFALAAGICFEWIFGAAVDSAPALAFAVLRTTMAMLAAWIVLSMLRLCARAIDSLPD